MKEKSHKLKYLMDKQGNPMDSEKKNWTIKAGFAVAYQVAPKKRKLS